MPDGILQARFPAAVNILTAALAKVQEDKAHPIFPRYIITPFFGSPLSSMDGKSRSHLDTYPRLLKAQRNYVWKDRANMVLLEGLLNFALSPHPRIR